MLGWEIGFDNEIRYWLLGKNQSYFVKSDEQKMVLSIGQQQHFSLPSGKYGH